MSTVTLTKWGNSVGIRVPAADLKTANAYVGEKFELLPNPDGGFLLKPIKDPRAGWLEAFNRLAAEKDGGVDEAWLNMSNEFDKDEWTW